MLVNRIRYLGVRPRITLKVISSILNCILALTGSQCRPRRRGEMWQNLGALRRHKPFLALLGDGSYFPLKRSSSKPGSSYLTGKSRQAYCSYCSRVTSQTRPICLLIKGTHTECKGNAPKGVKFAEALLLKLDPESQQQYFQLCSYYVDINVIVTFKSVYAILSQYHKELELDSEIQQSRTQTSANSERGSEAAHNTLYQEAKLIYRDPHWYSCKAKDTIHLNLHDDNISRDSGIEIPEPW